MMPAWIWTKLASSGDAREHRLSRQDSSSAIGLEWLYVDAETAGFFRIGEQLDAGTRVGVGLDGRDVQLLCQCRVVDVQFDIEQGQLIVVLEPDMRRWQGPTMVRTAA
jgi:hypothetical protein